MSMNVNFCIVITGVTLLSACGGGGGGGGGSPEPPADEELSFIDNSVSVVSDGAYNILVEAAANKANVQAAYIVVEEGGSQPASGDFFSDEDVEGRFNFSLNEANTSIRETNNEQLDPGTSYDVYIAIQLNSELKLFSSTPISITTEDGVVQDVWAEHCEIQQNSAIVRDDIVIRSPEDLKNLEGIAVIDGTLEFKGEQLSEAINLESLVCARKLFLNSTTELESFSASELEVVDSLEISTEVAGTSIPLNLFETPALVSAKDMTVSNTPLLQSLGFSELEAIETLNIKTAERITNLDFSKLRQANSIALQDTGLQSLSGFSSLESVNNLYLFSMPELTLSDTDTFVVKQEFNLSNLLTLRNLGGIKFENLSRLSIVDTAMDDEEGIYSGADFTVDTVNIVNTGIINMQGFLAQIESVNNLRLVDNDSVREIVFEQTENMESLEISAHENLESIDVSSIASIGSLLIGDYDILPEYGTNASLQTVSFSGLQTVGTILFIDNPALEGLSLPDLSSVVKSSSSPARCDFVRNGTANIEFPALQRADCRFDFFASGMSTITFPMLTDLANSNSFTVGEEDQENPFLESVSLPILEDAEDTVFTFSFNPSLTDIGVGALTSVQAINIVANDTFDQCTALEIWEKLGEKGVEPERNNTSGGCD
ncbi:MAG: hypothetical protein P8Y42_09845 [Exilibacterium sp.]